MDITEIINWIVANKEGLLLTVTSIVTAATAVARLTPTQKDDNFIEKVRKFIENVSNLFLPDNKQ